MNWQQEREMVVAAQVTALAQLVQAGGRCKGGVPSGKQCVLWDNHRGRCDDNPKRAARIHLGDPS
jgi:hypothetical protein